MGNLDAEIAGYIHEHVAQVEDRVATAIGLAARMTNDKLTANPPGASIGYGTVINAGPPADVQLDVDQSTIQAYSLGVVVASQRVAVLYTPPNGALILGAPQPAGAVPDWQIYLNPNDPDALRMLETPTTDADVRVAQLTVTWRLPGGNSVLTASLDVPQAFAINLPNRGDIGAKRADPTAGDYQLIRAAPDDAIEIGATNFAGQVTRLWGRIDMAGAQGHQWPTMTTTQRDALLGVNDGTAIYNTTLNAPQMRIAGVWRTLSFT